MAYRRGGQIRVSPMLSADSVVWALRSTGSGGPPSSDLVKAIIRSYIDVKVARGKHKHEINLKLRVLEHEFREYAEEFRAVRAEYHLPESTVFPASNHLRRVQTSTSAAPSRLSASSPGITRVHTTTPRISSTSGSSSSPRRTTTATTTRPTQVEDGDEPPPPPYARTDPEPESTRMLEARLAAEAEAAGRIAQEPPRTPQAPPTSPPASASSTNGRTNRPVTVYPTTAPQREDSGPQRVPSDPEMRQIWEESQFEEAKRLSIAAAREQKDLEEAMRLSLAEAEASGSGSGIASGSGGGAAGSSSQPAVDIDRDGRTADGITADLAGLGMPGAFDARPAPVPSHATQDAGGFYQPQHARVAQTTSLLDDHDDLPSAVPLTPMKTGAALKSKNPFLAPSERDEHDTEPQSEPDAVQSSAPFATPPSTQANAIPPGPSHPHLSPGQSAADRRVSSSSLRDSPGSGYTSFHLDPNTNAMNDSPRGSKPLPSPPGPGGIQPGTRISPQSPFPTGQGSPSQRESFDPPAGPPPPHLRIPTPPPIGHEPDGLSFGGQGVRQSTGPSRTVAPTQPALPPRPDPTRAGSNAPPVSYFSQPDSQRPGPPPLPTRPGLINGEDPLGMLKQYDTIFLIDDSASMAGDRWEQAKNAIVGVAEIAAEYDEDGIDVYFINSKRVGQQLKTRDDVDDLFAGLVPKGSTTTGSRLETILREYMSRLERSTMGSPMGEGSTATGNQVKPVNLIVVTDGAAVDDVESVIIAVAKRLDRGDYPLSQVGVQFFQIGNEAEAREAMQALDDGLSETHGVRDMVDTVPYNGEEMTADLILKTLLGGINRRLDRRDTR